VNQKSETK
jgi:hypothetical protein